MSIIDIIPQKDGEALSFALSYVRNTEVLKKVGERHEVYTGDSGVW
jgi:hypothetical protein